MKDFIKKVSGARWVSSLLFLIALFVLTGIVNPSFFTYSNIIACFNSYPVIQKYVIDPFYAEKGEINPEKADVFDEIDEETVFEDMGGKEKPIEKRAKGKLQVDCILYANEFGELAKSKEAETWFTLLAQEQGQSI